jgi:aldehyde dehydrogenase (NAD+)
VEGIVTKVSAEDEINKIISKQTDFFASNKTLNLDFRLQQLKKLYKALEDFEEQIFKALHDDFRKSAFETYGTEIALIQKEIKYFLKQLPKLTRPEKVKSSIASLPAKTYLFREPYGLSLIIGPWNYPLHLVLLPMVGSIASGNCIMLKPSELTQNTSRVIREIIEATFPEEYIAVIEGGRETTTALLSYNFDHICFTGSVKVGKIVYEAAAKNLIPCVLELGGKSPCIVDKDADLELAARRIVWGKLVNGGQTCVAPDYLLAHKEVKSILLDKIIYYIKKFYGEDPKKSPDFPRIINRANFNRLKSLILDDKIIYGGETDAEEYYISPTLLDDITWDDEIMQEEIFGPLLPVIQFNNLDVIIHEIKKRPKPLALYYFSKQRKKQEKILKEVPAGGGCINDTLLQFGSSSIPVGGIGHSGMGSYHGKQSFLTFSNTKGIVKKKTKLDIPFRYPPYSGKMKLLKLIFKL